MLRNKKFYFAVAGVFLILFGWAWREFRRQPGDSAEIARELQGFSRKERKIADAKAALDPLMKLEINEANIARATFLIAGLVTIEAQETLPNDFTVPQEWIERKKSEKTPIRETMNSWEKRTRSSVTLRYIFDLYAENYGHTREVLHHFLASPNGIPYFDLLIVKAAHDTYNLSIPMTYVPNELSPRSKANLKRIFADDGLIEWAKSRPTDLKQYSGMTNSIIGIYDWISYDNFRAATGFDQFPQAAEAYLDLGGGFATPDISRLIGKEFTSLDLLSPKDAEKWGLFFQELVSWQTPKMSINATRLQTPAEREAYLAKLATTKWLFSDVFVTPLPDQFVSYFITSFGFLSSTVKSLSEKSQYSQIKLPAFYIQPRISS